MPGSDQSASPSRSHHPHHNHRQDNNPPLFQFPKLPAASPPSSAVSSLQAASEAMTSDNNRFERPNSSLSESWATLSGSDIYSEDDSRSDQTDTASLVGRGVPDDVTSLEGRDDDDSEVDSVDVHSYSSEPPPPLPRHIREEQSLENSDTTIKPSYQVVSDSIEFVEPDHWPEKETVELKHTIKVFNEAEVPDYLRSLPHDFGDCHLSVTIQQTMAKRSLDLAKPFRALYIGAPDFKHIILDKMGDVLVAGSDDGFNGVSGDSSRFHVVPASFGTGASPNYAELLPIHVQLIVDECVSAIAQREQNKPSTISITLKNRNPCSSRWTGSGYDIQSATPWTPPDLAIFFIAQNDNYMARKIRSLCHTVMKRHGVPSMVISENPMWTKPYHLVPLDYQSLHICLESRDKVTGESRVLGRYPIDLKTFESIAPRQLNRNLASLSGLSASKAIPKVTEGPVQVAKSAGHIRNWKDWLDSKSSPDGSSELLFFGIPYNLNTIANAFVTFGILAIGLLVIALITALINTLILLTVDISSQLPSFPISPLLQGYPSTTASLPPKTTTTSTTEASSLMPLSVSDLISPDCGGKDSFDIDTYISKLTSGTDAQGSTPDKFQVHVIGDCHIIIKLPSRLSSRRKAPKFDVTVARADQKIAFHQARLFDGVYTLRLQREDAYGPLNVSITTKSKPIIEQVTEVDFGKPWLKIANWKRAAQKLSVQLKKDINLASGGLSDVFNRVSVDLHEMSDILRGEIEFVGRASLQRALRTTSSMLARSKQLSEKISRRTQDRLVASTTFLRKQLSTVNTDMIQFANRGWHIIEKEARRLYQNPTAVYDFNFARSFAVNAKRVGSSSQGLAVAQKQAAQLWRRLRSGPNNEQTTMRPRCEKVRRQKARRAKIRGSRICGRK
ncbi:hypothetical protein AJ78_07580 [Emergomyces pasteurianus Ep9510]|uniref:Uncharacterized protein n=1 Tax=Emergomyces pasteurianus Ep9510 TaxID=1447872 RepID=A0A1J9P735_9EURO|nr:hypothetical protein AJ78_07580 [Emergomyces pasteurianus Ep9510]